MQLAKEKIERRRVVVVSFAEPERLVSYQRRHQWPFVMLADPYRSAYGEFSLARLPWYRLFSPSALMLYAGLMLRKRKVENYG
ncbi:MAG: hypothetical protein QF619_02770, partial [Candidatus Binatia bacterium]|nr:hypothetical protein [Candidatus Binatia bacterium]